MFDRIITFVNFEPWLFAVITGVCLLAGIVRGFTGFGYSAVLVAIVAVFLAPIELLPIALILEAAASLFLLRGTWRDAEYRIVLMFLLGSLFGYPAGLSLTMALDPEVSKIAALGLILFLVTALLMNWIPPVKKTWVVLAPVGLMASFASGIAGVGGLVYAAVFLALQLPPKIMRATIVLHLLISLIYSISAQTVMGVMDEVALARGVALIPITLLGVWIGKQFFVPGTEKYYRRICMGFLVIVTLLGLGRLILF